MARVHERLFSKVEGLSESQQTYRPEEGSWTIAEIMEHLANVQEGMGKVTSKLIKEAEASESSARSDGTIGPVSMEFLRELADQKFDAPENVRPAGGVRIEDSVEKLKSNYTRLLSLKPKIEALRSEWPYFPACCVWAAERLSMARSNRAARKQTPRADQSNPGFTRVSSRIIRPSQSKAAAIYRAAIRRSGVRFPIQNRF